MKRWRMVLYVEFVYPDHTYTATVRDFESLANYMQREKRPYRIGKIETLCFKPEDTTLWLAIQELLRRKIS